MLFKSTVSFLHFILWLLVAMPFAYAQKDLAGNQPSLHLKKTAQRDELVFDFDRNATTPLLNPVNISAVINDASDPAMLYGAVLSVTKNNEAINENEYAVEAISSNDAVVKNKDINIQKSKGKITVKIKPSGIGYATITLQLVSGQLQKTMLINYAASSPYTSYPNTCWHTFIADASDAIALDDDYYVTGDDEQNGLFVYSRKQSGLPLAKFNYGNLLGLKDCINNTCSEVDVEAAVKSIAHPQRIYWMGSMSNGKAPKAKDKPNRSGFFATNFSGTGAGTTFSIAGSYIGLKENIVAWGDEQGYKLSNAAAPGQDPKEPNGFNAEGLVFAPDNSTLYIAMRAPLMPLKKRSNALMVAISNFEKWFNDGKPLGKPSFEKAVELDLGERGIRDIVRLSNGVYIIAAGSCGGELNTVLYKWSGNATDSPILLKEFTTAGLNIEGIMEVKKEGKLVLNQLQVVCDDGKQVYYNDGIEAKETAPPENKKFVAVLLTANANVLAASK